MRVAVIGARGQLGAAIVQEMRERADVVAFDHAALDITRPDDVAETLAAAGPDAIVNCAGYNAVDAAEDHAADAFNVNALAVRSLARAAMAIGAVLVQFSSDFVFDGPARQPYVEDDRLNPRSVYAMSKMVGEWFAADAPRHYVLRVESLFGTAAGRPEKGSVAAIAKGLRAGTSPTVFEDRVVSPTYVPDAARATLEIMERRLPFGLYHCVNSGCCTWAELAREAARLLDVEPKLTVVPFDPARFKAPRPKYCALSSEKLRSHGVSMPGWKDALARYLAAVST